MRVTVALKQCIALPLDFKRSDKSDIKLSQRRAQRSLAAEMKFAPILLLLAVAARADDRVKVSVYYETLCPDSIAFITKQLWPTYQKMKDIMIVDLVVYGNANVRVR